MFLLIVLFFGYQFYTQSCEEKCEANTESKCSSEEKKEIQYKELFLELGGTDFAYIPCLNDSNDHISLIADLIDYETKGW